MNSITPVSYKISPLQSKNNIHNKSNINFEGSQIRKAMPVVTALASMVGVGYATNNLLERNYNTKKAKARENLRKISLNLDEPNYLKSNFLFLESLKPLGKSVIGYENMPILERFIQNRAFNENDVLLDGIMDKIMCNFIEAKNERYGVIFRDDAGERSAKIRKVMDKYLNSPSAQKSDVMQKEIGFIMYRAGEAPFELVQEATKIISNPALCNNKNVVDNLLYRMIPEDERKTNSPEIEKAQREMDKLDSYKMYKAKYSKYSDWSITKTNLPIVEKFLSNERFTNNETWKSYIPYMINSVNENEEFFNKEVASKKVNLALQEMDEYLADEDATTNSAKTQMYTQNITEIFYLR